LQRHFGIGDPNRWEEWAANLAHRFRSAFWVDSPDGPHPAVALDGRDRPVSALTSNIGHLLGTGICNEQEAAQIAHLFVGRLLNSGYGLRTMATDTAGYNPLGYHTGSVWTHDTMIAASGLATDGFHSEAAELVLGLVDASASFQGRMPELFGGYQAVPGGQPTAYAASCRPQAWSAASLIEGLKVLLGIAVDIPHGIVRVAAPANEILRGLSVDGLVLGGREVSLTVSGSGELDFTGLEGIEVVKRWMNRPASDGGCEPKQDGRVSSPVG
ncbi:MAG: amylo-alpha-1,6-glucosidase, partial [Nocardioidaceae bacterium]